MFRSRCRPCHWQHVGARVHHDEEEDAGQIEALQVGVVLHHQVQDVGHLLHQDGVEGQQQLEGNHRENMVTRRAPYIQT